MSNSTQLQRLGRGTYGSGGEKIDWSYYDSMTLLSTLSVYRFFTIPLGQSSKTLDVTNMTTAGQLPQGQRFTIHAIKLFLTSAAAIGTATIQMIYTFLAKSTIEFIIPGKDSLGTWTLQELMGSASNIAVTPTVAGDNVDINRPRYHGVFPLNTPIVLASLTPFEVRCTFHTATNAAIDSTIFKVSLNGKLERAS